LSYDKYSDNDYVPAYLKRDAAINIAQAVNCRLPREEEWEYLCRSGTNSLFVFGNDLPPDDEMERWLDCDFSDLTKLNANPFGLYGMFNPEWCEDEFKCNYNHDAPKIEGSYVVRGGGAYF
jgi:formylglycine-generating enzyme required for sulfatase activity